MFDPENDEDESQIMNLADEEQQFGPEEFTLSEFFADFPEITDKVFLDY